MPRICIATSTRADWGILSPLAHALQETPGVELQILATNMHLLDRFGYTADEIEAAGFHIDARVELPDANEGGATARAEAMGICLAESGRAFEALKPDAVIILGDRFEMLAVASAAAVMTIPIIHISGGEVTGGAIDDAFRHAITKLASLHLVSAQEYADRVIRMGASPEKVVNTGSLGVWNMINQERLTRRELCDDLGLELEKSFAVATFHPATLDNEASPGDRCRSMLDALDRFPELNLIITYPNNDTGSEEIIREIQSRAQKNPGRVKLVKSLGLKRYLSAAAYAEFVIGNSSSGIIEVPSLGTPVINIGIRQKGRLHGPGVIDCGDDEGSIATAIREALSNDFKVIAGKKENPYYSPDTLKKSVDAILKFTGIKTEEECGEVGKPFTPNPLYIIPARGGSKGIPRKNIKLLGGKPLIAYAIDNARRAGADDRHIILSTDDNEIAEVARSLGLAVDYVRPKELATDTAGSREVILDAMEWADAAGISYNCTVLLQPTSPLRTAEDIANSLKLYSNELDMVVSVCESDANPYYNLFEEDEAGYLHISKGSGQYTRRQDAPKIWKYNGAVYVINPCSIREMSLGQFPRKRPYVMPQSRSVDLDTPDDWRIAEEKIKNIKE